MYKSTCQTHRFLARVVFWNLTLEIFLYGVETSNVMGAWKMLLLWTFMIDMEVVQCYLIFFAILFLSICSKLNKGVLTSDNMELLRDSVSTLTKTLKHVEVSGVCNRQPFNCLLLLCASMMRLLWFLLLCFLFDKFWLLRCELCCKRGTAVILLNVCLSCPKQKVLPFIFHLIIIICLQLCTNMLAQQHSCDLPELCLVVSFKGKECLEILSPISFWNSFLFLLTYCIEDSVLPLLSLECCKVICFVPKKDSSYLF